MNRGIEQSASTSTCLDCTFTDHLPLSWTHSCTDQTVTTKSCEMRHCRHTTQSPLNPNRAWIMASTQRWVPDPQSSKFIHLYTLWHMLSSMALRKPTVAVFYDQESKLVILTFFYVFVNSIIMQTCRVFLKAHLQIWQPSTPRYLWNPEVWHQQVCWWQSCEKISCHCGLWNTSASRSSLKLLAMPNIVFPVSRSLAVMILQ